MSVILLTALVGILAMIVVLWLNDLVCNRPHTHTSTTGFTRECHLKHGHKAS